MYPYLCVWPRWCHWNYSTLEMAIQMFRTICGCSNFPCFIRSLHNCCSAKYESYAINICRCCRCRCCCCCCWWWWWCLCCSWVNFYHFLCWCWCCCSQSMNPSGIPSFTESTTGYSWWYSSGCWPSVDLTGLDVV